MDVAVFAYGETGDHARALDPQSPKSQERRFAQSRMTTRSSQRSVISRPDARDLIIWLSCDSATDLHIKHIKTLNTKRKPP